MKQLKKKKCKICRSLFPPFSTTSRVCGMKCAIIEANTQRVKKLNRDEKIRRIDIRARKKKFQNNDLPKQKKLTQTVFNKLRILEEFEWFKVRGIEPYCISCGKEKMDWCCSHLKTVASHGELRYDRTNTKLACNRYCNKGLSGNIAGNKNSRGYLVGLEERFGYVESIRIIDYCNKSSVKKWTCEELINMRAAFNKEIRRLRGE